LRGKQRVELLTNSAGKRTVVLLNPSFFFNSLIPFSLSVMLKARINIMVKINFALLLVLSAVGRALSSVPDTIVFLERPDFYEIHDLGDLSAYSYFLGSDGFLTDINSTYDNAFIYKVIMKGKTVKEFINQGKGLWQALYYNNNGKLIMQGLLKETGKTYEVIDTINPTDPEPPYNVREIAYHYHETIKEGYWLFYDLKLQTIKRKVLYVNGIESN
jgi:hypothetical protein